MSRKNVLGLMVVLGILAACSGTKEAAVDCVAACGTAECGEVEGCLCGTCSQGTVCQEGTCTLAGQDVVADPDGETEDPCVAACGEQNCGFADGCDCGSCPEGETCSEAGQCEAEDPCFDACAGLECGMDGECECGSCDKGDACQEGSCVCVPNCGDHVCGPDGCGESCGECAGEESCGSDGQCHDGCPEPEFQAGQKVNSMVIGDGGHPGEALDVDGDPDTCAPADDCEQGLNNQLSGLLVQLADLVDANSELAKAIDEGTIVLLAEFVDYNGEGETFTLNMYLGDPVLPKEECDFQNEVCDYLVDPGSFDVATCQPFITFDEAIVEDGVLKAGGPESLFSLSIPVSEGLILTVTANMAQVQATLVDGAPLSLTSGLVGGAIRKDKLLESIDAVPDEAFEGLPVGKDMFKNLIDMFVIPDVDTDLDGDVDAASVGIKFTTVGANLAGLSQE